MISEIQSNIGLLIDIKLFMSWNFIPDENLNVNRSSNRGSVVNFEDGIKKGKDLMKRVEEVQGSRNTLLRLPNTLLQIEFSEREEWVNKG